MTSVQKKLAAKVLKVGVSKVWMDPTKKEEIDKAITKADIRRLIKKGYIKKKAEKKKKKIQKKKRKRGPGSKKGKETARLSRKEMWMNTVRPLRRYIKKIKDEGKIDTKTYRRLRKLIKGGMFRSVAHLKFYIKQKGLLKSEKNA